MELHKSLKNHADDMSARARVAWSSSKIILMPFLAENVKLMRLIILVVIGIWIGMQWQAYDFYVAQRACGYDKTIIAESARIGSLEAKVLYRCN